MKYVYARTDPKSKGKLLELKTDGDPVAFFDFVPLSLGEIRGFKVRFHLCSVPSGEHYSASRRLILKGVDGVVFVADANPGRLAATRKSWIELRKALEALGYGDQNVPVVVQIAGSKDGPSISTDTLCTALNLSGRPIFAATPASGEGVFLTLKAIAKQTLMVLKKGTQKPSSSVGQGENNRVQIL